MQLALDHMTVVDSTPQALAGAAKAAECTGICLFMEPMAVLPLMPRFDLYGDVPARQELRSRLEDDGLTLELVYPFTLTGRSDLAGFEVALACAAELGARLVNVLVYDRDPIRRQDMFARFCELARSCGLRVALEFYPVSQVRSLAEALELVSLINLPGEVGINADLLHLIRSGGTLAELSAAPAGSILFGQFSDGPAQRPEVEWELEASSDRLVPGQGTFDIAGFACALPTECPISIEVPRNASVQAGMPVEERARAAVAGLRRALGGSE